MIKTAWSWSKLHDHDQNCMIMIKTAWSWLNEHDQNNEWSQSNDRDQNWMIMIKWTWSKQWMIIDRKNKTMNIHDQMIMMKTKNIQDQMTWSMLNDPDHLIIFVTMDNHEFCKLIFIITGHFQQFFALPWTNIETVVVALGSLLWNRTSYFLCSNVDYRSCEYII